MTDMTSVQSQKYSRMLTMAALTLALSSVIIFLFRGPISILSAFLIPAIIVLFSRGYGTIYYFLISMGLLLISLMFFQTQLIFTAGYAILAVGLKVFLVDSNMNLKLSISKILLYLASVVLILSAGLWLTEKIFLIPLHTMMMRISGGQILMYLGILIIESVLVTLCHILVLNGFLKRIKIRSF